MPSSGSAVAFHRSGIPQVKVAYAVKGERMPFRAALGKFALGIIQIGSGASLSRCFGCVDRAGFCIDRAPGIA
jgi:H+/Cl- antiporter ClcA